MSEMAAALLVQKRTQDALTSLEGEHDGVKGALALVTGERDNARAELSGVDTAALTAQLDAGKKRVTRLTAELAQARAKLELVKLTSSATLSTEWHLRDGGETLAGPVSFDVLVAWARDCRVAHDHEISADGIFWAKACDVPGLEMEWLVTLVDGSEYGPINKFAVNDLIADGSVSPEAELVHCRSGEKRSVASVGEG